MERIIMESNLTRNFEKNSNGSFEEASNVKQKDV